MLPLRGCLRLLGCAGVLAVASCDSTGPHPSAGTYDLQTLNQAELPYDHEGLGCCVYLSGDLALTAGRYTVSLTFRNRNSGLVFTAMEWGKYLVHGAVLSFSADSSAVAPLGLDEGVLSGNGIAVSFGGEGHGSPDQFHGFFVLRE